MFKKLSRNFVAQAMANLRHRYLCEEILSVTVLQELFWMLAILHDFLIETMFCF